MQRLITTGLTVLLVSLVAPGTKAETRIERQLQLTHPTPISTSLSSQAKVATSAQNKANAGNDAVKPEKVQSSQLSERDRLVQERQRQIILPVQ